MVDSAKDMTTSAPWERRELPGTFSSVETAQRIGHYKWTAMRIFELLGGWVATVPESSVKVSLGQHCYDHSFHAELWHKRLPTFAEHTPESLTVPPSQVVVDFYKVVANPDGGDHPGGSGTTVEKLAGLYRVVLPHLVSAYTYHRNNVAELSDAPTIRILDIGLRDLTSQWQTGELMLQSLIVDQGASTEAARQQTRLGELVVEAGGVLGSGSIGARS